jgi:glutamate synthase domain-containing protein 2
MQAIGCLGMRACNTDNCPAGIATQKPGLRGRLVIDDAAQRLTRLFETSVELMTVLARACDLSRLSRLSDLSHDDLTTFDRELRHLAGIPYGGLTP